MKKCIENGIVISIGNQNNNVENSIITSQIASYIHHKLGHKLRIIVLDCCEIAEYMREVDEMDWNDKESYYKSHFRLLQMPSVNFPSFAEFLTEEYDIIFVSLPGDLKQPGVLQSYQNVDVLITPTPTSSIDLQSTIDFIRMYKETIIPERDKLNLITSIFGMFNRVDVLNIDFKVSTLEEVRSALSIDFLQNFVPESKELFQKAEVTSSVSKNCESQNYKDITREILTKIMSIGGDLSVDAINAIIQDEFV